MSPAAEDYGSTASVTITALLSWTGAGVPPTAADVQFGGTGSAAAFSAASCGAPSGDTMTCTATYTPSGTDPPGTYTITAAFSGDSNYSGSSSSQTDNFTINRRARPRALASSGSPSDFGPVGDVHGDDQRRERKRQGTGEATRKNRRS